METIASGHSTDGMNARMSDAPQTSTATNAAKPQANVIVMPRRRETGRRTTASIGRTLSAGRKAKRTDRNTMAGRMISVSRIRETSIAIPAGKAAASAATHTASASAAPATPTIQPTNAETTASVVTKPTTPSRVKPRTRNVAKVVRFASTERSSELTRSVSAVRNAATSKSGFA